MKAATKVRLFRELSERISIHAAREGGDTMDIYDLTPHKISIHAAREGGDICSVERSVTALPISIHAAREGGDPEIIRT